MERIVIDKDVSDFEHDFLLPLNSNMLSLTLSVIMMENLNGSHTNTTYGRAIFGT